MSDGFVQYDADGQPRPAEPDPPKPEPLSVAESERRHELIRKKNRAGLKEGEAAEFAALQAKFSLYQQTAFPPPPDPLASVPTAASRGLSFKEAVAALVGELPPPRPPQPARDHRDEIIAYAHHVLRSILAEVGMAESAGMASDDVCLLYKMRVGQLADFLSDEVRAAAKR